MSFGDTVMAEGGGPVDLQTSATPDSIPPNPPEESPDTSDLPARSNAPPPGTQSVQNPPVKGPSLGESVLQMFGGGARKTYVTDPDTGKTTVQYRTPTNGSLARSIAAAALTGLFAGAQTKPGPGGKLRALGAGANAETERVEHQDADARQKAMQDAKNQQEAQMFKMKMTEANLQQMQLQTLLHNEQGEAMDDQIARDTERLRDVPENLKIRSGVTEEEAHKEHKAGNWGFTRHNFYMDGKVPVTDANGIPIKDAATGMPLMQATYTIVDGSGRVPVTQKHADDYQAQKLAGFPANPVDGYTVQVPTARIWDAKAGQVNFLRGLSKKVTGNDKAFDAALEASPRAASAISDFAQYLVKADNDPLVALKLMSDDKDAKGKPKFTPATIGAIVPLFGDTEKLSDYHETKVNDQAARKAAAEELAKEGTPLGKAKLGHENAETVRANAEAAKAQEEERQLKSFDDQRDPFGEKVGGPGIDRKEYLKRYDGFSKDYVTPLRTLEKTNAEFQRILNDPKMTGAEKVTGLLSAVGISGEPLKGKGFRINNAVIDEHAASRNIWESAVQKANRIVGSGGPVTEQQIRDYAAIAQGVIHDAYLTAAKEARRQGLAVDFLPRGSGQKAPDSMLRLYLDAAGNNPKKALAAMTGAGWR